MRILPITNDAILRTTLVLGLALPSAAAAQSEERFTRTLEVGENPELSLTNVSGDIVVEGASGSRIEIEAVKRLEEDDDPDLLASVQIEVSQVGNRVRVETRHTGRRRNHHGSVAVDYRVRVPESAEVQLQSVSGSITLSGVDGEATAQSVSGDVRVTDAANLAEAKSVSGDVEVRRVRSARVAEIASVSGEVLAEDVQAGELSVSSVSGDVTLEGVSSRRASLESVSGNLLYTGQIASGGRYDFQSHSGDVVITIPGDVGFALEASTFSGEIESEFPMETTSTGRSGRKLNAVMGDGSAFIEATTFSGDVELRRR